MGKMNPELVEGYRKISKHVHANPDWWLFGIFDGFGAHMSSEKSTKLRYEAKIVMGKEEGVPLIFYRRMMIKLPRWTRARQVKQYQP